MPLTCISWEFTKDRYKAVTLLEETKEHWKASYQNKRTPLMVSGKNRKDHVWGWVWSFKFGEVDSSDIIHGDKTEKDIKFGGGR